MQSGSFRLLRPQEQTTSVIFASPHSGRTYPPAFLAQSVLDSLALRSSEDAFVDELLADATAVGAPLMLADIPRAFIDLNRGPEELDPALIEGVHRTPLNPRVSSGIGVIPRVVSGGRHIYRGKLTLSEAEARLRGHWHPYHDALRRLIDETHARFGQAILVDCHSMPHEAIESHTRPGQPRPEVVLGDRFGAAAGGHVIEEIEAAFQQAGLRVSRNVPFAGAFIAQSYGRPSTGRHVVQIEIDRSLYMNEAEVTRGPGFAAFRAGISAVLARIADIGRPGALRLAAE
ncbi:MAG: N-formylglutamate amidohydrolase [Paracoccaceae bacterium]